MPLEIGPYVVDVDTGNVYKKRVPMKWGGKASQLFVLLLKNAPDTISKEDIFNEVWKGRVVTENTLYKTISKLRQEINPEGVEVESVFGEGYRLITTEPPKSQIVSKSINIKLAASALLVIVALIGAVFFYNWKKQQHLKVQMVALNNHLIITKQAFMSQINRRNELGEMLSQRFELKKADSWEKRFYELHDQMNERELFLCKQVKAFTDGPLYESNLAILRILTNNPDIVSEVPLSQQMISHMTVWLSKYSRVFKNSQKMCLLYVGVEDGAAYPSGYDELVSDWIQENN